jgi:hypothetical protein
MQFSPRTRMEEADRIIAGVARLMQSTVYLLPQVPVLYLKLWQDPGLRFEVHLFHEAAIALATLEGATLTPVALRASHVKKRQLFELARGTRVMRVHNGPLRCLHRDGNEFLANGCVGSVMFDGKQCVLALLRARTREQQVFARQRAKDRELIERGRLMNALQSVVPAMLFALQRHADGSYDCGLRSEACAQGLAVTPDATPLDWIQQWFNRVLPRMKASHDQ